MFSEGNAAERFHPTSQNYNGTDGATRSAARLAELEECIERGLQTFVEVGRALAEIRDRRLYCESGFQTFEDYCLHRWGWTRAHAYRQMEAARVVENLSPIGDIPRNDAQARELAKLKPDGQREIAQALQESGQRFETLTASDVGEIVQEVRAGTPTALAVHYSSESADWCTPPEIVERAIRALGGIDLDPCSNSSEQPAVPAALHYTPLDDGLAQAWHGRVYMNPPYGDAIQRWVEKLLAEYQAGHVTSAIALLPARTDTAWFRRVRDCPVCFVAGRLKFSGCKKTAPFPSAVVYLGDDVDRFEDAFESIGDTWMRRRRTG